LTCSRDDVFANLVGNGLCIWQLVEEAVKEVVPLGRMGRKWDIGMAVLYLTSEAGD